MSQPDNKKRILDQTKTQGCSAMYQKNSQKKLASISFSIVLKNSRYFMDFNKNYGVFSCFFEFLVVLCSRKVLYGHPIFLR